MRSPRCLAAIALTTVVSTGCLTTTPSMQSATGPLKVNGHIQDYPAYVDNNLGYHEAGSSYVFENYTVGDTEVDELTFFHVAGDTAKAEEITAWRKASNTASLAGWSITGAGIGAAAAGAGLLAANADDVETFATTPLGQASFGLMAAGGVVVGLAFYSWTIFGPEKTLNSDDLLFDPGDGMEAAELANARMAGEPTPTTETQTEMPAEAPSTEAPTEP